jgi:hypothetical protein
LQSFTDKVVVQKGIKVHLPLASIKITPPTRILRGGKNEIQGSINPGNLLSLFSGIQWNSVEFSGIQWNSVSLEFLL